MSTGNSLTSRLEELRSRNPQSPQGAGESLYSGYNTPTRYSGSFMVAHSQQDNRASLQRRFTVDSNIMPALSPIGHQPTQNVDNVDMTASTLYKVQALEKKRMELEKTREQRRRFDMELERFNRQQALEEKELEQLTSDLHVTNTYSPGHQSEPTTPPEYREPQGFPSIYSRRNRYSSSSLVSPPGLNTRLNRSGSQLTSPPPEQAQSQHNGSESDKLPSKSVPGSRRGSSDKFSSFLPENNAIGQRPVTNSNRYSMPVTSSMKQKRESVPEYSSMMNLGHINTTSFLFGDDEPSHKESATSPDVKTYLQMNTTDDKFPILIRNNQIPGVLSASSAALDLALAQSPGTESSSNGWPAFSRHRHSQASLPQMPLDSHRASYQSVGSPTSSSQPSFDTISDSPTSIRKANRHSMDPSLSSLAHKSGMLSPTLTNGSNSSRPALANLQSSYSTNDIPTLKNGSAQSTISQQNNHAQQHFHNHNASLGRIPPNAMNNRVSRDLSITAEPRRDEHLNGFKQAQTELQASAAPFGAPTTTAASNEQNHIVASAPAAQPYAAPAYYGGYGMQLMNMGMNPVHMANPTAFNSQVSMYQTQNQYGGYPQYSNVPQYQDSQTRIIQQRRMQSAEENARFTNAKIESYQGEIYSLCKDQHGCRYLQKQMETRNPETVQLIFQETQHHVVELMTDPFGNYLCQKLLEHSNDAQRTVLVNNSAPQMVKIALNQHGTRALQKMIEYISTPEQIQTIIHALKDKVVELIQDLNGNHVIQKCLNRLSPEDAQFIFDAVGKNCIVVGTHRHGCCVLQRCIDHASGQQKADLIAQITQNAFALVQDPFGNYVLQYIVDLNDIVFTNPMCYSFQTHIPELSKHKFSSNVIEKCIRHADPPIATMMIEEMLNANELDRMLRDSYANYVVQTAIDFSEPETRVRLIDAIRPILPSIRQTPYGRRIQSKIMSQTDGNGTSTPAMEPTHSRAPNAGPMQFGSTAQRGNGLYSNHNQNIYGANGMMGQPQFTPANHNHKMANGSGPFNSFNQGKNQPSVHQQPVQTFNRPAQANGFNYF